MIRLRASLIAVIGLVAAAWLAAFGTAGAEAQPALGPCGPAAAASVLGQGERTAVLKVAARRAELRLLASSGLLDDPDPDPDALGSVAATPHFSGAGRTRARRRGRAPPSRQPRQRSRSPPRA